MNGNLRHRSLHSCERAFTAKMVVSNLDSHRPSWPVESLSQRVQTPMPEVAILALDLNLRG